MNWSDLTAEQQTLVWCLAEGDSLVSACRAARIHPSTMFEWCQTNLPLLRVLAALEQERRTDLEQDVLIWLDETRSRLQRLLTPETTQSVRLDVCLFLINRILDPAYPDYLAEQTQSPGRRP